MEKLQYRLCPCWDESLLSQIRLLQALSHGLCRSREGRKTTQTGIWNPESKAYRDYPARKRWWRLRADFIENFGHAAQGNSSYINLADDRWREALGGNAGPVCFPAWHRLHLCKTKNGSPTVGLRSGQRDMVSVFFSTKFVLARSNIVLRRGALVSLKACYLPYRETIADR